ncbi:lysozyme [Pantoea ananatis]|uniref:lysozyme n=1 Tax=Pantoea ananas TaxID=553 RepID=UPI00091D73DB|nr:lysozyme [Pantoea ananatis]SFX18276.1 lysozyme [Pantoea ananatis]
MATAKKVGGAASAVCSVAAIIAIVLSNGHVRTNQRGLELIGNAESCRRDPYVCPAGVLTNGIGNTHNVKPGVRLSDEQIAATWEKNILDAESCVNRYGNGRNLTDNTFSAAVSVTFRSGCGNLRNSQMFSLLRKEDITAACHQLPRWVWGGGMVLPGLVKRANNEMLLCLAQ